MRKLILSVLLVAVSTITTAQETYKNHSSAPDFEWYYVKGDTNLLSFKGNSFDMNGLVYNWLESYGIDPASPSESFIDDKSGANVMVWFYENEYNQNVRMMYFNNKQRSMVMCRVLN